MNYTAHLSLDTSEYEAAIERVRREVDHIGHETVQQIILNALDGKCSVTIQHAADDIKHES